MNSATYMEACYALAGTYYRNGNCNIQMRLLGDKPYVPVLYVVHNDIMFTLNAARRAQGQMLFLDKIKYEIEPVYFEDAWKAVHKIDCPEHILARVDDGYNTRGAFFEGGELYAK